MERLKNKAHTLRPQASPAVLIQPREIRSLQQHTAAGREIEPREQRKQGRFARPIAAN